jgi:two-component system cell cycle response regulator DivK
MTGNGGEQKEAGAPLAGTRVLIIEDTPQNLRLFRAVLRLEGAEVLEADRAAAGIEIAGRERPDIILMDIQMPEMDGLEATRRLRRDEATRAIPIIAVTASVLDADRHHIIAAGCDGYIPKPIDPARFGGQIAAFLPRGVPAARHIHGVGGAQITTRKEQTA